MSDKKKPAKKRRARGPWDAIVDSVSGPQEVQIAAWHYRESKRRVVVEVKDAAGAWICTAQILVPL